MDSGIAGMDTGIAGMDSGIAGMDSGHWDSPIDAGRISTRYGEEPGFTCQTIELLLWYF